MTCYQEKTKAVVLHARTVPSSGSILRMRAAFKLRRNSIPGCLVRLPLGRCPQGMDGILIWNSRQPPASGSPGSLCEVNTVDGRLPAAGCHAFVAFPQKDLVFSKKLPILRQATKVQDVSFDIPFFRAPREKKLCKTRCGPETSTPPGALSFPPSILLLMPEGHSYGDQKQPSMEDKKKHNNRVSFKLTDEEYNGVNHYIASLNSDESTTQKSITFSEGLRRLIQSALSNTQQTRNKKPILDKELVQGISGEIAKIGVNVNQLAKNMNTVLNRNSEFSPSTVRRMVSSLDMIAQHLDDILERVKDFST